MKKIFVMMAGVLLIAGQAVAAGSNNNLDIQNVEFASRGGITWISGEATNTAPRTLKSPYIKFNLLKQGNVVGSTITTNNPDTLESGQKWLFEAPVNSAGLKPDTFKITEINAQPQR